MGDGLFELDDSADQGAAATPALMSLVQRETIRDLFARIGVTGAREQFDMVAELTGVQISSVAQLEADKANLLIHMLSGRASRAHRMNTGNSWADRDEDTWIDRL
ncbi:hypothetical protein [Microbacterium sp. zg.Y1084]|uniref:hypothetical protein n=1 Tax=Microbacterium sp. zg.Y1084 TaxID=2969667 RepID=UPI00214A9297|nr:hypothetical protein [Microbacterium sp. zg.Y1084]MCR2813042.1 hypothetical protein [Microbacterium sp. zg.Y1084]